MPQYHVNRKKIVGQCSLVVNEVGTIRMGDYGSDLSLGKKLVYFDSSV